MSKRIHVRPNIQLTEMHNEAIVFSIDSGIYFSLDEVGLEIWNLISHSKNSVRLKDIEEYLLNTYKTSQESRETVGTDVSDFVYSLKDKGLVDIK